MKKSTGTASPSILTLSAMAAVSGFVGALFGTPSDIANIRMQNDRSLQLENRRNYRNVFDAWIKMKRHEGWRAFYQGLWPNCFRCAIMTTSQLASYDIFKGVLQKISCTTKELPIIHLSASLLASLVATTLCSPMDIIRTQLMSSSKKTSLFTVVKELARSEGYRWVFRGWTPSFLRLGPQTIATLIFMEQHRRVYRIWKGFE
jgi:dicarboxylate transporter 10